MTQRISQERRIHLGFAVLCLLSGSGWILGQFWTSPLAPVQSLAVENGCMALLLALWLAKRRKPIGTRVLGATAWATVLFTLPALVGLGARGHVEQFTSALVYTLVPALVLFMVAQQQTSCGLAENRLNLMLPALAGFGGAALLFPFRQPESAEPAAWLLAVITAAGLSGFAALRLQALLVDGDGIPVAAGATAIAALIATIITTVQRMPMPALTAQDVLLHGLSILMLDLPALLLVLWLVRLMPPVSFAARYLLIPAVTILEGLALLRPEVTWTTPMGLLLMIAAGGILMRQQAGG